MVNRFRKTARSTAGAVFELDAEVKVSKEGIFSIAIPEEIHTICETLVASQASKHCNIAWSRRAPGQQKLLLQSARLADAKTLLAQAAAIFVNRSQTESDVIAYRIHPQCAYVVAGGQIFQNGSIAQTSTSDPYEWRGSLNGTSHAECYSLGVGAGVFVKTVDRFSGSEKIHYARKSFENFSELWGARLNSFVGLDFDAGGSAAEIPYTEENARFFHDLIMGLIALIDKTTSYLASPSAVVQAIERRKHSDVPLLRDFAASDIKPVAP
jgi:hypothetical protein